MTTMKKERMTDPLKAFKSEGMASSLSLSHKHNEDAES